MIPSRRWFPLSLQARAAWFENFSRQFEEVGASLGFNAAKITAVANDNAMMQFLAEADIAVKAYEKAVMEFRQLITEGDIGDTLPQFPADPNLTAPASVPTGIFERLDRLVDQIENADAYTTEIGALLGILPRGETETPVDELKPELKGRALPNYQPEISFTRGSTGGISIQIQRGNSDVWTDAGNFFKSPAILTITPTIPNTPEAVRIRARYLEGNTAVGEWSDTVNLVVSG